MSMQPLQKITRYCAAPLLLLGLTACIYYPVPVYPNGASQASQSQPAQGKPQECREYEQPGTVMGKTQQLVSTACRQPDGTWKDAVDGVPVSEPPLPVAATTGLQPIRRLPVAKFFSR